MTKSYKEKYLELRHLIKVLEEQQVIVFDENNEITAIIDSDEIEKLNNIINEFEQRLKNKDDYND